MHEREVITLMKKLYEKSEIYFALVWIGLYVVVMNIALQVCGGLDDLAEKSAWQVAVPVVCILILAVLSTAWVIKNRLAEKYGLCRFAGSYKGFLFFIPLILMSCVNLKNGLALPASFSVSVLMMLNLAIAGYVEELIFRGFLFRAMEKDNLRSAIIVSAVTFGVGHIVNVFNTSDIFGVILQVCYAIVIGFLYTVTVYLGGSLWPCIISHMFVNGTSVFACEEGAFSELVGLVFGSASENLTQLCSSVFIILISGTYAVYLWKRSTYEK